MQTMGHRMTKRQQIRGRARLANERAARAGQFLISQPPTDALVIHVAFPHIPWSPWPVRPPSCHHPIKSQRDGRDSGANSHQAGGEPPLSAAGPFLAPEPCQPVLSNGRAGQLWRLWVLYFTSCGKTAPDWTACWKGCERKEGESTAAGTKEKKPNLQGCCRARGAVRCHHCHRCHRCHRCYRCCSPTTRDGPRHSHDAPTHSPSLRLQCASLCNLLPIRSLLVRCWLRPPLRPRSDRCLASVRPLLLELPVSLAAAGLPVRGRG